MKTLVIGGGMSGLTYGILAAANGADVTICEKNNRVGKKISQTGNGKCNIGNALISVDCYNGSEIAGRVLDNVSVSEYVKFLQFCGIYTFSDELGRMYPLSESANGVVDCLRYKFSFLGGKILTDCEISNVTKQNNGFSVTVNGAVWHFDKVVLACGSGSSATPPNLCGAEKYLTKLAPSLVPVKICNMDKGLNGLRAKCNVSLLSNGKRVAEECGEIQFKDYGLSGICIFNLSARIARDIVAGRNVKYTFCVDVVPSMTVERLASVLEQRQNLPRETLFYGILHNKLAEYVLKQAGDCNALQLATAAKRLQFPFDRLLDFSKSQVTCGGLDEKYLNLDTLTLPNGVVAVGEVLNVDGLCGGNNLYFAAASAMYLFDRQQREKLYANE